MIAKTKGIVLRSVKFGETSLVVNIYTELFGLQSYLVNGVRTANRRGSAKAAFFQPASLLELVVYHNDFNNLQRIREFKWAVLYNAILSDVIKNAVAAFMIELLSKCVKEPEANPDLFYFVEDVLLHLDEASPQATANFPLFYALHLAYFFGFRIGDEYSEENSYLDLQEGVFVPVQPRHQFYLHDREAEVTSHILKAQHPSELEDLHLNQEFRRRLLQAYEQYYVLHLPEFGALKSLPVLREMMG
ncbi:DNA repair protein RecO [Paracnuella aquatica]|uniref:DNA repair protein RecO n=1 Tax=Paracnuella aquatica TaxID=2268757 RepID=UPI000DEEE021|nr:DNA repair protein RecO [Paracnuella aquatica]RPD48184.1 DNA repair protein RecO [Paracnuella aquatica]